MGPPGAFPPRHRVPHPMQQQQPQYPSYQPPAPDTLYSMGDQHPGINLNDLGWGAPATTQANPFGTGSLGYANPQNSPQQQQQQRPNQTQPG